MDDNSVPTIHRTDLTTILRRLEAATSRLEDMAASSIELPSINGAPTPAPTGPLPAPPVAKAPELKPVQEALPESVEDFDSFIAGPVKKFVNLSDELGGPIAEQVGTMADNAELQVDSNTGFERIAGICRATKVHLNYHESEKAGYEQSHLHATFEPFTGIDHGCQRYPRCQPWFPSLQPTQCRLGKYWRTRVGDSGHETAQTC